MKHSKKILFSLFSVWVNLLQAQLTAVNSDTVVFTQYQFSSIQDPIYVFYGPQPNGWNVNMTLEGSYTEPSTFIWMRINNNAPGNWDTVKQESNVTLSRLVTTANGNYRLQIKNSTTDTSFYCVIFANNLYSNLFYQPDCDELKIRGITTTPELRYFNRFANPPSPLLMFNPSTFVWKIDYWHPTLGDWVPDTESRTFLPAHSPLIQPIPRENELYRITVEISDILGHNVKDTLFYQAISVEANFVASIGGNDLDEEELNIRGQAPFRIQFKNRSKNAVGYRWEFWHRTESLYNRPDTVWKEYYTFIPPDSIEYLDAGNYSVKLVATGRSFLQAGNEKRCVDEKFLQNYITVYESMLGELPNVFTPTGDGINDLFTFKTISTGQLKSGVSGKGTRSIKHLEISIYNRNGERVYNYSGDDEGWQGWNGQRNGKGAKVSPGVYFYVIRALGYDGVEHKKHGFVHLYY